MPKLPGERGAESAELAILFHAGTCDCAAYLHIQQVGSHFVIGNQKQHSARHSETTVISVQDQPSFSSHNFTQNSLILKMLFSVSENVENKQMNFFSPTAEHLVSPTIY